MKKEIIWVQGEKYRKKLNCVEKIKQFLLCCRRNEVKDFRERRLTFGLLVEKWGEG